LYFQVGTYAVVYHAIFSSGGFDKPKLYGVITQMMMMIIRRKMLSQFTHTLVMRTTD